MLGEGVGRDVGIAQRKHTGRETGGRAAVLPLGRRADRVERVIALRVDGLWRRYTGQNLHHRRGELRPYSGPRFGWFQN